jgi:hypothetical protein
VVVGVKLMRARSRFTIPYGTKPAVSLAVPREKASARSPAVLIDRRGQWKLQEAARSI